MTGSGPETGAPGGGAPLTGGSVLISGLPRDGAEIRIAPGRDQLEALAQGLGLLGLRKLRLEGSLRPEGSRDWRLEARLGATVTQPCAVTLTPVTTRIEERITRLYLDEWVSPEEGSEIEMPEDDAAEPLPRLLNLDEVLEEALSLALPLYPRAEDADFAGLQVTEPGQEAMSDEAAKPFAGLAGLRAKLTGPDGSEEPE